MVSSEAAAQLTTTIEPLLPVKLRLVPAVGGAFTTQAPAVQTSPLEHVPQLPPHW